MRDRHRVHRCPAARVTGTGCNWTPITYVHAAGEIGKEKEKKEAPAGRNIKANEPRTKQNVEEAKGRKSVPIGRPKEIYSPPQTK